MEVIRKKANTIWLFNYTTLASLPTCTERIICMSEQSWNIVMNAIQNIDLWQTRVYTEANGDVYTVVDDEQFYQFQLMVANTRNQMGEWALCNDILQSISDQLAALVAKPCCPGGSAPGGGSRGAGLMPADPSPITSSEEAREGPPPEGFESWEEYDTYKCDMAYHIIGEIKVDIATTAALAAGGGLATALATILITALLVPISWPLLVPLAIMALQWFALGLSVSLLTDLLEDNADGIACAMFLADTVANSISAYGDAIDELVAADEEIGLGGAIAQYTAASYLKSYATTDNFNRLYNKVPYEIETGNSCAGCGPGDDLYLFNPDFDEPGTLISGNFSTEAVIQSNYETVGGELRDAILLAATTYPLNNRIALVEVIEDTTGDVILDRWEGSTPGFTDTYANLTAIEALGNKVCTYYAIYRGTTGSSNPFTVRLQFTPGE